MYRLAIFIWYALMSGRLYLILPLEKNDATMKSALISGRLHMSLPLEGNSSTASRYWDISKDAYKCTYKGAYMICTDTRLTIWCCPSRGQDHNAGIGILRIGIINGRLKVCRLTSINDLHWHQVILIWHLPLKGPDLQRAGIVIHAATGLIKQRYACVD